MAFKFSGDKYGNKTSKKTHLTFSDRNRLQGGLANRKSFKEIGLELHKSASTISREIKAHMFINKKGRKYSRYFNDCVSRNICKNRYVYDDLNCDKDTCGHCGKCIYICKSYDKEICQRREKPPYVCNGCPLIVTCDLEKRFYDSAIAQKQYEEVLKDSRDGIAISPNERDFLGDLLRPLLRKGQSIHHIHVKNKNIINVDEKTLYNYIEKANIFLFIIYLSFNST